MNRMRVLARGLAAGAAGTAVMTAWQELAGRLAGSGNGRTASGSEQQDAWEQAPTPAKVARKIGEGMFDREIAPEWIGLLTNAMHWGYGMSWGFVYALLQHAAPGAVPRRGVLFGAAVWSFSYVTLVPMRLYQPPWSYPLSEVSLDLSYHLVYGIGVAGGFALLER